MARVKFCAWLWLSEKGLNAYPEILSISQIRNSNPNRHGTTFASIFFSDWSSKLSDELTSFFNNIILKFNSVWRQVSLIKTTGETMQLTYDFFALFLLLFECFSFCLQFDEPCEIFVNLFVSLAVIRECISLSSCLFSASNFPFSNQQFLWVFGRRKYFR